jgi:hypothetical protein
MSEGEAKKQTQQVRLEIDNDVADGIYANLAFITNNNAEFIIDFARFLPGNTRGKVVSRVVLGPINAKGLLKTLEGSVKQYEDKYGDITPEQMHKNIGFQVGDEEKK